MSILNRKKSNRVLVQNPDGTFRWVDATIAGRNIEYVTSSGYKVRTLIAAEDEEEGPKAENESPQAEENADDAAPKYKGDADKAKEDASEAQEGDDSKEEDKPEEKKEGRRKRANDTIAEVIQEISGYNLTLDQGKAGEPLLMLGGGWPIIIYEGSWEEILEYVKNKENIKNYRRPGFTGSRKRAWDITPNMQVAIDIQNEVAPVSMPGAQDQYDAKVLDMYYGLEDAGVIGTFTAEEVKALTDMNLHAVVRAIVQAQPELAKFSARRTGEVRRAVGQRRQASSPSFDLGYANGEVLYDNMGPDANQYSGQEMWDEAIGPQLDGQGQSFEMTWEELEAEVGFPIDREMYMRGTISGYDDGRYSVGSRRPVARGSGIWNAR